MASADPAARAAPESAASTRISPSLVVALLAAATSSWTGVRLAGLQLSDALIAAALAGLLVAVILRRRPIDPPLVAFVPPLVTLVLSALGLLLAERDLLEQAATRISTYAVGTAAGDAVTGPLPFLLRLTLAITVVALICHFVRTVHGSTGLLLLLQAWVVGVVINAGAAVVQDLMGVSGFGVGFEVTAIDRSVGLAFHPNSLAQSATMAVPVLLFLAFAHRSRTARIVYAAGLGVCLLGVLASGSRAGLVGAATALLTTGGVLLLLSRRYTIAVVSLVVAVGAATVLLTPGALEQTRFGSDDAAAQSTSFRVAILRFGWELFREYPIFGAGVGSWSGESVPLIMLTSGGLVLLFAFYSVFVTAAFTVAPHVRSLLGATLLIAIGVLFVYGFLNNGFGERYLYWCLFIGYELYRRRMSGEADETRMTHEVPAVRDTPADGARSAVGA